MFVIQGDDELKIPWMVWMIQGVKSIIGAQMDLIFAYIVEQTLTKIRIDAIIWIEVVFSAQKGI